MWARLVRIVLTWDLLQLIFFQMRFNNFNTLNMNQEDLLLGLPSENCNSNQNCSVILHTPLHKYPRKTSLKIQHAPKPIFWPEIKSANNSQRNQSHLTSNIHSNPFWCSLLQVQCCCFSPGKAILVFAGTSVGSVLLWDLREHASNHYGLKIGEDEWTFRQPTFSTGMLQMIVDIRKQFIINTCEGIIPQNQNQNLYFYDLFVTFPCTFKCYIMLCHVMLII